MIIGKIKAIIARPRRALFVCSLFNLYKIKKCELEAEREVNPHTQSPHSHSILWAHLGLNQGPPDYESGALTN